MRLVRFRFSTEDADDLAERLHLRDVHADHRRLCPECGHYTQGQCGDPSLKLSPNGVPPGPGHRYGVHFLRPGPGVIPSGPA
jgi:hypothetical protein